MILEVRLSNIKSYSNQTLRFTDGVNAIIGENGAGKTTILEAIGFAVFDSLPYKIGDFLRRGEKRGEVCVRLLSPKDDRVYEIVRKFSESGTNEYYVHDSEGIKVAEGILEVTDWVKENFDVEINTKTMFENAIGVSQGKIVSQFLETASVRDKIFSPILGIEGYKKAFEKSREYEKYLEEKISKIDKDLAVKRKDIERKNKVEERIRELEIKKTKLKNMLDEIIKKINPIKSRIEEFEKVSSKINDLKIKAKEVNTKLESIDLQLEKMVDELDKIKEIEKEIVTLKQHYEMFVKADKEYNLLNSKIVELESKLSELRRDEVVLARLNAEIENLTERLKKIENSEAKLQEIVPMAEEEEKIQNELKNIENLEKILKDLEVQINRTKEEIERKTKILKESYAKVELIKKLKEKLSKIPDDVEKKRDLLLKRVGKLKAELEIEKREYEKVKENVCPILNESCDRLLHVKTDLERKIKEKILKIKEYEEKLEKLNAVLDKKKKLEVALNELKGEIKQIKELKLEVESKKDFLSELIDKRKEIKVNIEKKDNLIKKLKEVEGTIKKRMTLESEIREKDTVIQTLKAKRGELERIKNKIKDKDFAEKQYLELRSKLEKLNKIRAENKRHYERFLQIKDALKRKKEILKSIEELKSERKVLIQKRSEIEKKIEELEAKYDEEVYLKLKENYQNLISKKGEIEGSIKVLDRNIAELERELEELLKIEKEVVKLEDELKKIEKKYRFIKDLREIFKRAIPEITKAYVNAVSIEANRIFCEIMDDHNWEITWTEDFGIKAKYRGREIDFVQMSGGEQMCAALAIRLALLRVLSNVGIAFFDEPTQNMDETRRRNLAAQLSKIEGFKQIFVISHDDTFEEMVENAIRVVKKDGVSLIEF